jgi:capping protein beta
MPPDQAEKNLAGLAHLISDDELVDQIYQRADKPMEGAKCLTTGSSFIKCEYNRDADSYRSPWSNQYQPPIEGANLPSDSLRALESECNTVFSEYVRLYYDEAISSVYLWETGSNAYAASFLVKKDVDAGALHKGTWESTSLVSVTVNSASRKMEMSVTATVYLHIQLDSVNLCGSLSRQQTKSVPFSESGTAYAMISQVEAMETTLRSTLDTIYVGKTQEILNRTRKLEPGTRFRIKLA